MEQLGAIQAVTTFNRPVLLREHLPTQTFRRHQAPRHCGVLEFFLASGATYADSSYLQILMIYGKARLHGVDMGIHNSSSASRSHVHTIFRAMCATKKMTIKEKIRQLELGSGSGSTVCSDAARPLEKDQAEPSRDHRQELVFVSTISLCQGR